MSVDDELETSIRTALRERAADIPDAVPPSPGMHSPVEPQRRTHGLRWVAVAIAAAVVAAVLFAPRGQQGSSPRLRTAEPGPEATVAPMQQGEIDAVATTDKVVFRAEWGSGPQQLASDRMPEPTDARNPSSPPPDTGGEESRGPGPMAVSPDERHVYISDSGNRRVVRVNVAAGRVDRTYPLAGVRQMAVDPLTGDLYTASDDGTVDATRPNGKTSRVYTPTSEEEAGMNLIEVNGPREVTGVYGATMQEGRGLFRLSGPDVSLKGWPVGDALMSYGFEDKVITADVLNGQGGVVRSVALASETGWKATFPEAWHTTGSTFRILAMEQPDSGTQHRMRLYDVDNRPSIVAVYSVPTFRDHLIRLTANAVWALETADFSFELHKVTLPPRRP